MSTAQLSWINETAQIPVPAAADYSWYAIQVRTRFEKKVATLLQRKGFEIFLPLIKQLHRWSDRRKVIEVPLFPGYGFAQLYLNAPTSLQVVQTAGVIGFVRFNGEALPIPQKQIEDIQQVLAKDVPCAMHPFLKAGQKIRIRGGCLDGLEGVLADCNSDKALLLSVEAIERTIAIQIEGYDIELV